MSMTGTIVNALAIVAGGAVGLLFQRGIPERVSKTVMIGLGLCVLYIGISGAFACQSILIVILSGIESSQQTARRPFGRHFHLPRLYFTIPRVYKSTAFCLRIGCAIRKKEARP